MENKILRLTQLWYEYVGMDHHKDCDCHWYISKVWSYGGKPYYRIEHYGYIYENTDSNKYKTYEEAERALYRQINKALREELKLAKEIIRLKKDYDAIQIERAVWLIKNHKEE